MVHPFFKRKQGEVDKSSINTLRHRMLFEGKKKKKKQANIDQTEEPKPFFIIISVPFINILYMSAINVLIREKVRI